MVLEEELFMLSILIPEVGHQIERASREISFAYDWEVKKGSMGFVLKGKKRSASDRLDVGKVQDDALAFSVYLIIACSPTIGYQLLFCYRKKGV